MTFRARWAVGVAFALTLGLAQRARGADLAWKAPNACPLEADVREQAERLLGAKLESVEGIAFDVEISEDSSENWRLRLQTTTAEDRGVRELSGSSCAEVSDAGAVAIAMAVQGRLQAADSDADAVEMPTPVAEASDVEQGAEEPRTSNAAPPERDTPQVSVPPRASPGWSFALGATLDSGVLPAPTPGVELDAALRLGGFRLLAFGAIYASQSANLANGDGGTFQLALAGLLGCLTGDLGGVNGDACVGAELGDLSGEGTGVSDSRLGSYLWRAGRVEFGARLPLSSRLSVGARAGVVLPFERKEFVLNQDDVVHEPGAYSLRGFAGLEVLL